MPLSYAWATDLAGGTLRARYSVGTWNGATSLSANSQLMTRSAAGVALDFSSSATINLNDKTLNLMSGSLSSGITLNGVISGTGGLATVSNPLGGSDNGNGVTKLIAANTYSGPTSIPFGTISLVGLTGSALNSAFTIAGGTLLLDNTTAANNTDRLGDSKVITMQGGTLNFKNDAGAANFSETVALTLGKGTSNITTSQAAALQTSALTIGTFVRNAGTTAVFTGTDLGVNAQNRIFISPAPTPVNGVIPWATYGTTGYANYDGTNGVSAAVSSDDITLGSTIPDGSTKNVRILNDSSVGNIALSASPSTTTIHTLLQDNATTAATVDTLGRTLATSGIMIAGGRQALTIGAAAGEGKLTAGTDGGELILNNSSANALTLNAVIENNTSASSVVKTGTGSAIFAGTNIYTGPTSLAGGVNTATTASAFSNSTVSLDPGVVRLVVNDSLNLANDINLNSGGESGRGVIENSGAGNATLSGNITINSIPTAGGHFASNSAVGSSLTISGPITSTVPVSVRAGTVIFENTGSSYSLLQLGGTLKLGAPNVIPTSATVDVAASGTGILDLNGFNQTLAGITRVQGNTATIGNSSTTTPSVLTITGNCIYAGNIANVIAPGTSTTTLKVANGANIILAGGYTANTPDIQSGGTLTIGVGTGDAINPATKALFVPSGALMKSIGLNRVQNDVVITVDSGGTFDENGQADVIGYINGGGSITNLDGTLTMNMPGVGSGSDFSGTITGNASLLFTAAGLAASASSTQILSGANSFNGVNVTGGRLIGRNASAFGPAGKIVTVGTAALTLDPTIEFDTNAPMNSYVLNIGSGNTGTIELNQATSGVAFTQPAGASTLGNGTLNIEKGAKVTSGTPTLEFSSLLLSAGGAGLGAATLNPVGVNITVLGNVTRPGTAATNLKLDGDSTGNVIKGAIQDKDATNKLAVEIAGPTVPDPVASTWTLSGANTYSGNTTVAGTLELAATTGSKLTFYPKATTVSNKITGAGTANLKGKFDINLAGAAIANGNEWTLVDVTTANYDATTFLVTSSVGDFSETSNVWTKQDNNKIWTFSESSGKLSLSVSYANWAVSNAGGLTSDLDYDNDGVENGVEYFMNAPAGFTANPSLDSSNKITWTNGGNIPSTDYGTQFVVETSPDLSTWTKILVGNSALQNVAGSVSYTLPPGAGKLFVRLVVTPN